MYMLKRSLSSVSLRCFFRRVSTASAAVVDLRELPQSTFRPEDNYLTACKQLNFTLESVKKEMAISKIQNPYAKAFEDCISEEQRSCSLNEQHKFLKKELGLETDDKTTLCDKFREQMKYECRSDKVEGHLQLLEISSREFNVTRKYLDWLTVLPWGNFSEENFDVLEAKKILDEDFCGLSDVKERILELLSLWKLRGTAQGKIICLSGPHGVGKTIIGRSIARTLNRKFYKFSVGGLSDITKIKGSHRANIGAMPGQMVQCLKNVGTANPLVLIEEIDKLGRGLAESAMLELFDPEQNSKFVDHYIDVPIDLSKVLFVCTANVLENIHKPLLDRMEVISIAGYKTDENMHMGRDNMEKITHGFCSFKDKQVEVTDAAILALVENFYKGIENLQEQIDDKAELTYYYRRKAGVWSIQRKIKRIDKLNDTWQTALQMFQKSNQLLADQDSLSGICKSPDEEEQNLIQVK